MLTPSLFDATTRIPDPSPPAKVERRPRVVKANYRDQAETFIKENPAIWSAFVRFAQEAAACGGVIGAKFIAERVRWEMRVVKRAPGFKINNNHVAFLARELVRRHPELAELIRFRRARF
jgi:hypothetical protein